jgi:hypothetical protein
LDLLQRREQLQSCFARKVELLHSFREYDVKIDERVLKDKEEEVEKMP